jgi:hypothetical protein
MAYDEMLKCIEERIKAHLQISDFPRKESWGYICNFAYVYIKN